MALYCRWNAAYLKHFFPDHTYRVHEGRRGIYWKWRTHQKAIFERLRIAGAKRASATLVFRHAFRFHGNRKQCNCPPLLILPPSPRSSVSFSKNAFSFFNIHMYIYIFIYFIQVLLQPSRNSISRDTPSDQQDFTLLFLAIFLCFFSFLVMNYFCETLACFNRI